MEKPPSFDLETAHSYFGPACFNATWDLIRTQRSEEDDLALLDLAHSSFWHWSQRPDCTRCNRSIGYWLLARVHALAGHADLARRYGKLSLTHADDSGPFYQGFAHEALARAGMVAGNRPATKEHLQAAKSLAARVKEPEKAAWLTENLANISLPSPD